MNRIYKPTQQGSALLMTLVVIMISIALVVIIRNHLWIQMHGTRLAFDMEDLQMHALGAESWAIAEVKKAHLFQTIPFYLPKLSLKSSTNIEIKTQLVDLQSLWNINHIGEALGNLPDVLKKMALPSSLSPEALSQLFVSLHATQGYMRHLSSGYYVPSQIKARFSVSSKDYPKWLDWTWVLPEKAPINLNTASVPVLMTLGEGLTEAEAQSIVEARENVGLFSHLDQLIELPIFGQIFIDEDEITLLSRYFLIKTLVSKNDLQYMLYTMIKVQKTDRQLVSKVIWRMTHM